MRRCGSCAAALPLGGTRRGNVTMYLRLAALCATIGFCAAASAAVTTTVVDLTVNGGRARFLYVKPDAPTASIIAVSGGDGVLNIADDGSMNSLTARCGPIVRNREAFASAGIALALMDSVPSLDQVIAVDAYMRARHPVPSWIAGGSSATAAVAYLTASAPPTMATGALFYSPGRLTAAEMSAVRRPSLVLAHANDGDAFPSPLFNGLTAAPVKERISLSGGTDTAPCGFHLFNGLDAQFVSAVTGFISRHNAATGAGAAEAKYQALWWADPPLSENGWGVNVVHQGDILFATWFTYDADGPMWLVMSNGARVGTGRYTGVLYRTRGPAFDAVPFDPTLVKLDEVGSATFQFSDENRGTFSYVVGGAAQTKAITRQVYSTPVTRCTAGGPPNAANFQDLWWQPAESGWGVNLTHQGDILFGTWFTYRRDGKGDWLVMSNLSRSGTGQRYSGDIFRTGGAPFSAYDASRLSVNRVGTASFDFTGASTATFTYTLDGVTQSKQIIRQEFSAPTTCR